MEVDGMVMQGLKETVILNILGVKSYDDMLVGEWLFN